MGWGTQHSHLIYRGRPAETECVYRPLQSYGMPWMVGSEHLWNNTRGLGPSYEITLDLQQRPPEDGHRWDHARNETENSRVVLPADPIKNGDYPLSWLPARNHWRLSSKTDPRCLNRVLQLPSAHRAVDKGMLDTAYFTQTERRNPTWCILDQPQTCPEKQNRFNFDSKQIFSSIVNLFSYKKS